MDTPDTPTSNSTAASRRDFITRAGTAAGGLLLAGAAPASASGPAVHTGPRRKTMAEIIHDGQAQQQYPAVVRSDVTTFTAGSPQLAALQNGVSTMKGRGASDRTSWTFQAGIHDTWCDNPPVPNGYVHYSWRFLVWHRAYLYFMEQILQKAAGSTALALPYWNWTVDLKLPSQYWGQGNPLFDPRRVMTPTSMLDPRQTAISGLLALSTFDAFGGTVSAAGGVEVGPHNYVHRSVGGNMGAFSTAALDPIFWAHHANVDRVWSLWLAGSGHANPVDPAWLNQSYPFYDTAGNQFDISFQTAASLPVFYNAPPQVVALATTHGVLAGPRTVSAVIDPAVSQALAARTPSPTPPPVLHVSGVMVPSEAVTVNVFANRPGAAAGTPTSDRGFAGSFTLIPSGHQHDVNVRVPLHQHTPELLTALAAAPEGQRKSLSLTLVPVGAQTLSYERVELEM